MKQVRKAENVGETETDRSLAVYGKCNLQMLFNIYAFKKELQRIHNDYIKNISVGLRLNERESTYNSKYTVCMQVLNKFVYTAHFCVKRRPNTH